jgi:hypothetical protein
MQCLLGLKNYLDSDLALNSSIKLRNAKEMSIKRVSLKSSKKSSKKRVRGMSVLISSNGLYFSFL